MATCTPAQLLIGTVIVHSTVLWEGKQRQQILMEVWADERKSVRNLYVYVSIKDRYMSLSCIGGAGGGGVPFTCLVLSWPILKYLSRR